MRTILAAIALVLLLGAESQAAPVWQPEKTRVVVISLATFAGESAGNTSFSIPDRLDDPLVGQFLKLGVPLDNMLYLKDAKATKAAITKVFPFFLKQSQKDETLLFYYSSHGGYDPETGAHTYSAFDDKIGIGWFVGNIEALFRGSQVMLFSDCCFSGGMVDLAKARGPKAGHISYGALSTTGSCNLGYSGWRFTDVLLRAWAGDVAMDFNKSGTIDFLELCLFAESYMAFVAEGKPLYATTGSFDGTLVLSKTDRAAKKGIGMLIEAKEGASWYKAEVIDVKDDAVRVHFTDKKRYAKKAWLPYTDIRDYEHPTYKVGTRVEVCTREGEWVPGKVIEVFENMHECSIDGRDSLHHEWMSPSRIRLPR